MYEGFHFYSLHCTSHPTLFISQQIHSNNHYFCWSQHNRQLSTSVDTVLYLLISIWCCLGDPNGQRLVEPPPSMPVNWTAMSIRLMVHSPRCNSPSWFHFQELSGKNWAKKKRTNSWITCLGILLPPSGIHFMKNPTCMVIVSIVLLSAARAQLGLAPTQPCLKWWVWELGVELRCQMMAPIQAQWLKSWLASSLSPKKGTFISVLYLWSKILNKCMEVI